MVKSNGEYQAEFLNFGKIVASEGGPVVGNPSERITSHSIQLPRELRLTITPESIVGEVGIFSHDISSARRDDGALIIREPDLRGPAVLARIRFPSESGAGKGGRHYAQMTAAFVAREEWLQVAPALLRAGLANLAANPDTLDAISSEGDTRAPIALRLENPRESNETALVSLWHVLNVLADDGRFVAGPSLFSNEHVFLQTVARLVELSPREQSARPEMIYASGLSASSTAADLVWSPDGPGKRLEVGASVRQFAEKFAVEANWRELVSLASEIKLRRQSSRVESIRQRFSEIRRLCSRIGASSVLEPSRTQATVRDSRLMFDWTRKPQASEGSQTGPTTQIAPIQAAAPALFNDTGIPRFSAVNEMALGKSENRISGLVRERRVMAIPTLAQAARAMNGEVFALNPVEGIVEPVYWISLSREGIENFARSFTQTGPQHPQLLASLDRFAKMHHLFIGKELVHLRSDSPIRMNLAKLARHSISQMIERSNEAESRAQHNPVAWAETVLECLVIRLENGVLPPDSDSVQSAWTKLAHYDGNALRRHERDLIPLITVSKSNMHAPGREKDEFEVRRAKIEMIFTHRTTTTNNSLSGTQPR